MIVSAGGLLALIALGLCIVSGVTGKVPLWVSVLLLCIAVMVSGVTVWRF